MERGYGAVLKGGEGLKGGDGEIEASTLGSREGMEQGRRWKKGGME